MWLTKLQSHGVTGGVPATVSKRASELGDHINHRRNPALFQLDSETPFTDFETGSFKETCVQLN